MRFFFFCFLFFASSVRIFASPISPLLKLGLATWDDAAKIALKASGKSLTDDAVKGAARTLEAASTKYGDDVLKKSLRGGVEVSEQALRHGKSFIKALRLCPTDIAARNLALHSDDVLKLSAKYGDSVIRLNSKIPGQTSKVIDICERSGFPVQEGLELFDAGLKEADLTKVIGALTRTSNPKVQKQFLKSLQAGGSKFVDNIFKLNGRQILASGLSGAMIVAAGGVAGAVAEGAAPSGAVGRAVEQANETAIRIINDPTSTPSQQKWAREILQGHQKIAEASSLGGLWQKPLIILAVFLGLTLLVRVILRNRSQKHSAVSPPSCDAMTSKAKEPISSVAPSAPASKAMALPEHLNGDEQKQCENPRDVNLK